MKEKLSDVIYKKDFQIAQHGYKVEEVDRFLDEIMFHVKELENEIDKLKKEKEQLQVKQNHARQICKITNRKYTLAIC